MRIIFKNKFTINDVIGRVIMDDFLSNIDYRPKQISLPINVDIDELKMIKFAMKYSDTNDSCATLQFEYNIMKQIQGKDNMKQYRLTNLHKLIPWIEWLEMNRFTRVLERRCILVMEQIENVKTFEGIIKKKYARSYEFDNGLISFILNCYNDLIIAFIWTFNYYHIDINGVNISLEKNITTKRTCYLIDLEECLL